MDRFIEFRLGKEQLDGWTLGPAPGPLPRIGPCQRGRRGMGPAAAHKGSAHYHSSGGPLENLQSGKKTKGQSNMDWARGRGWGSGEAGRGRPGSLRLDCASQGGLGAGMRGCQPCGVLGWTFLWSPSQNGFGVPPTKDLVWMAEGRGTLWPGASRVHPWLLLWPSPLMARCGSTGQLPTLPTWSPKPRGK